MRRSGQWLGMWVALALGAACSQSHEPPAVAEAELNTGQSPTTVPVLEFPARYQTSAAFMTGENWYAINYEGDGLVVHLHATNAYVERPADLQLNELEHGSEVRGSPAFETMDEGIRVLSWMEQGAAYSLDVTCRQEGDERCADSAFLIEFASALEPRR